MVSALPLPLASVLTGQPEVIGSSVLAAAAASVSFSFPSVYRAVLVEAHIIRDANAATTWIRANADSGNNYSYQYINASGVTVTRARATAQAQWVLDAVDTVDASARHQFSALVVKAAAAVRGQLLVASGYDPAATIKLELTGGEWNDTTSLLSRIDVLSSANNFASGTSIVLWGYRF